MDKKDNWCYDENGESFEFSREEAYKQYKKDFPVIKKGLEKAIEHQRPFIVAWVAKDDLTNPGNYRAAPGCTAAESKALILAVIANYPSMIRYEIAMTVLQGIIHMDIGEQIEDKVIEQMAKMRSVKM